MRNTGIVLFLAGIFVVLNSGSFRDLIVGKAQLNFNQPSGTSSGTGGGAKDEPKPKPNTGGTPLHPVGPT